MPRPQQMKRYLIVETPQTTDGKTLRYDENRQVVMKTTFLPITAKAELLRNTSKLPDYLRPKITEADGDAAQPPVTRSQAPAAQQNAEPQQPAATAQQVNKPRTSARPVARKTPAKTEKTQ